MVAVGIEVRTNEDLSKSSKSNVVRDQGTDFKRKKQQDLVTDRMEPKVTLRFFGWVIGQIMEEFRRKVGLAVRLVSSVSYRLGLECQWEKSPVRGYTPEV